MLTTINIMRLLAVSITTIIMGSCSSTQDNAWQSHQGNTWNSGNSTYNSAIKDTIYSIAVQNNLRGQVMDYMVSCKNSITASKFERYTPAFVFDWAISNDSSINRKQLIQQIVDSAKSGWSRVNSNMKKMGVTFHHEIKDSIRMFVINDTVLFANLELSSYYFYNGHKSEAISNFVSISTDGGKRWMFLDKDGCKESLEYEYGAALSSEIMAK